MAQPVLKLIRGRVDQFEDMIRSLVFLTCVLVPVVSASGQERVADVRLDDGKELTGKVLSMDLELLVIEVGDRVLRVPAERIRSCRFQTQEGTPAGAAEGDPEQVPEAVVSEAAPVVAATEQRDPAASVSTSAAAEAGKARVTWTGPLPDPVDPGNPLSVPVDQRHRSHWQERIEMLDARYPWLAPAAPSQWISLGLLLLVGSALILQVSVKVAGAERPQGGTSLFLAFLGLVGGLLQFAFVPVGDFAIAIMLLVNTSLGLFLLKALYGMQRPQTVVAMIVQLGFGALVFGVLELVSAVLGSVVEV